MKKTVLKISVLLIIPFLLTIPYTSAWFSSQAVSSKNTIKAGSLSFTIPDKIVTRDGFENIYPGWSKTEKVTLKNDNSLNLKCKVGIYCNDNSLLYSGKDCIKVRIYDDSNCYCEEVDINKAKDIFLGKMDSEKTKDIYLHFSLPQEADNDYSGKTCSLNFIFDAVQENAPLQINTSSGLKQQITIVDCHNNKNDGIHFSSINEAISAAAENGEVYINSGTYNEEVVITKGVKLKGTDNTLLNNKIKILNANNVQISKLKLINNDASNKNDGILMGNSNNVILSNVECKGYTYGLNVSGNCSNVTINSCSFNSNKSDGLILDNNSSLNGMAIENCDFSNNKNKGANFEGSIQDLSIYNGNFDNNNCGGIYIQQINNGDFKNISIKSDIDDLNYRGIELKTCDSIIQNLKIESIEIVKTNCAVRNPKSIGFSAWRSGSNGKDIIENVWVYNCTIKNYGSKSKCCDEGVTFNNLNIFY